MTTRNSKGRFVKGGVTVDDEQFASLKLMATLSGIETQVREYISDWILVTFDLPTTDEGNKARTKFLNDVRYIGGIMHSESCYLLPSSPASEVAAIQLAELTPKAYIWFSHVKDDVKARDLTREYDEQVEGDLLKELRERVSKTKKHAEDGKEGIVNRMHKKTSKMIADAAGIAARRGSEKLASQVARLKSEFEDIKVASDSWASELKDLL